MSDIVARLRALVDAREPAIWRDGRFAFAEAADEIEQIRSTNARLSEALTTIHAIATENGSMSSALGRITDIARTALTTPSTGKG